MDPAPQRRVPQRRRHDRGETFEALSDGLPQARAYDLVYRHGLAIDRSGDRLAMGSTTGGLWTTDSGGDHWYQLPERLPPIVAVTFAGKSSETAKA